MSKYRAVYISPIEENKDNSDMYNCRIEEVYGDNAGLIYKQNYIYPKEIFKGYFHGTLLMFCKDNQQITNGDEILANFPVKLLYIKAINTHNMEFYGSDGVLYNYKDNYYSKHNSKTFENMKQDLSACDSFYALLVVDRNNGHIIDITLVTNPTKDNGFAYTHRLERGFVPTSLASIKTIGQKEIPKERKGDEKLTQEDIDNLIDKYVREIGITL